MLLVGAHALAVEGRQHQLAALQVLAALEEQDRALAEERLEDEVAAGGDGVDPVGAEKPLDGVGVGDEDDVAGANDASAEGVAEAAAPGLAEADGIGDEAVRLHAASARGSAGGPA